MSLILAFFIVPLLFQLIAGTCDADDCLRALRATSIPGRLEDAKLFCSTFTHGSVLATAIPSYAIGPCRGNQNLPFPSRVSSACSCLQPTIPITTTTSPQASATGPCAEVSRSVSLQLSDSTTSTEFITPTVSAKLAIDCLKSVPLGKEQAIRLVDSLTPYLEWQSDLVFKKNPPADYFFPPHDVLASLALIKSNLQENFYPGEYEFSLDLYRVFIHGHDGHFIFLPDALTAAFEFVRPKALVSISEDGIKLPQIKLYGEDVLANPSTAPTITQINGVDAAKFISNLAFEFSAQQDADAAYNAMFYEEATYFETYNEGRGFFSAGGRGRFLYPGENTTMTFDNGTTFTFQNVANLRSTFRGVSDGASYYEVYCDRANIQFQANEGDRHLIESAGYPFPLIADLNRDISGFYLNGAGFDDVAVLGVVGFAPLSTEEFQYVAENFFAKAIKDGKTKLVVDLSANGGGYILQSYDLFRQLFPTVVQQGLSRFRESDTFLTIAKVFSDSIPADFDPRTANATIIDMYESWFNYRYDLNVANEPFEEFGLKFAHEKKQEDFYTALLRWNLEDELTTINETWGIGIGITGYRNRTNYTQPFKTDDIILLTDGYCASACSLFTDFMRAAGVKIVTMGGRPQEGSIQAVGGVKGSQSLTFNAIYRYSQLGRSFSSLGQNATLNRLTTYPMYRSIASGVNARDTILLPNIIDGTPSQFIAEFADCRLFWTAPMITNVIKVWEAAANVAFNGAPCAAGSLPMRKVEVEKKATVATPDRFEKKEKSFTRSERTEYDVLWEAHHGRKVYI